jgi:polyhydroxyalkanoate synthesis regulator phasin
MPSMKILDYTIRETDKNQPNTVSNLTDDRIPVFATKDEIKAVSEQITALRDRVDNLTRKRRREDEDE